MTATAVARRLGGRKVLKRDIRSNIDLDRAVGEGLSYASLAYVMGNQDLAAPEVYALIGSRRTLGRKSRAGGRLSPVESDRLARVVRIIGRAEEALGDRDKAHRWLRKENRSLGGKRPLDLLASDPGALQVEQLLGRIEHGIPS